MEDNTLLNQQNVLISKMTGELPVLRARLGISQDTLARVIGISRQTLSSIESKRREMSWTIFIALFGFFEQNDQTSLMLSQIPGFMDSLNNVINQLNEPKKIN